LSLDERDNDLRLFLTYFLEAIRTLFPSALQETRALLKAGSLPPVSVLAASLLNELEGIEQEFILVLDDFHRIQDPSVLDLLGEVLRYPAEPRSLDGEDNCPFPPPNDPYAPWAPAKSEKRFLTPFPRSLRRPSC
jgi:LuxR family maltose regulon positive regulatory protein